MRLSFAPAKQFGQELEIAATIGETRLWYRIPSALAGEVRAEPFLVAGLMPAMARGEKLEVSSSFRISPRLFTSLPKIQQILHVWVPALKEIEVQTVCGTPAPPRPGSACFFSGGVDSAYTFLKHKEETTHLVLIHGLDIRHDDEAAFSRVLDPAREIAQRLGKTLIPVRTNAREFCKANGLTMVLFHGALLASVALLLGFERSYIPASQTYDDLEPWGSHALLDPLWSTESSEIIYDGGEAGRVEKVRVIAAHPDLLASLRVCSSGTGSNCGACEKCLLTLTALRLVRAHTSAFPELDLERLKKLKVTFDNLEYFVEMCEVAAQNGDIKLHRLLNSSLRRFETKQILKRADAVFLGGTVHRLVGGLRDKSKRPALLRTEDPTSQDGTRALKLWRMKTFR
jgi:7-cyano-7-deazaguanine synthase in queuosine biosynthesis